MASLNSVHYIGFSLYFDVFKSRKIISRFPKRWIICNYDVECILTSLNDLYTIYDKLNDLERWMCFDYVERFVLFLNDLKGSMALPAGKKVPRKITLELFLPLKSQQWALPHKSPYENSSGERNIALQQIKNGNKIWNNENKG